VCAERLTAFRLPSFVWRFIVTHYSGRRIVAAMLFGLIALPAQSAPLTLDEALRLAQERSRQLPAQDAAAAAAREMAVAAGQRPDPTLKAGIGNLPINGEDRFSLTRDFMTMRSVGLTQELTRASKLRARSARYERDAEVAEAGRTLALANLQRDTAMAWLDRFYQERMRDVLIRQRDEARLQVEAADAAHRGGRGSQADVFTARSAAAQVEDRIAQVDQRVATAKTQLARWIGAAAGEPLAPAPSLDAVRLRTEDLEAQIAHHPQIAVLRRQEAAAQADAEVASADKRPDWSIEVMLSQRGPAYSNMVSLNVSVPLQWDQKNRQDRELAARLAMVERARAQREEETRMHVAEALAMLQEWRSNRERLQRYDASLLPLAGERTKAALAAYRGGTGPLSSVIDARRAEIDTSMERLRLEMDTARLWSQLNYLAPADQGRSENSQENPQ
jgi:outer membrane protein TolC